VIRMEVRQEDVANLPEQLADLRESDRRAATAIEKQRLPSGRWRWRITLLPGVLAFPSINERPRTVPFLCSSSPLWRGGR
jgi:hypothetical protein